MSQIINKAYKFRIYPTKQQEIFFSKHFGCCRFIYNHFLALRSKAWRAEKRSIGGYECKRMISQMKKQKEYGWLKGVNSQSLQEACLNLERAYRRFFKELGGYPTFRKKHGRQSFAVPQGFAIDCERGFIKVPKLKTLIQARFHRDVSDFHKINFLVISKNASGKYYVSINGEMVVLPKPLPSKKEVGIDLGLLNFIKMSDGEEEVHPRYLRNQMKRLKFLQRKHTRKVKGSRNRNKHRRRLALFHERILNRRTDFLHKLSRKIIDENQVIYLEDLNVKGMMGNHRLAQAIGDAGWSELVRQIKYKASWIGRKVVQIGAKEPSTKLCSTVGCDYKNEELKLSDREWKCPKCQTEHDRDLNAARNIRQIGQDMPELKPVEKATPIFSLKKRQVASEKQEPLVS